MRRSSSATPGGSGRGFRYEVGCDAIIEPDELTGTADDVRILTQRYTTALEAIIRRDPEQYLWLHRRWKHQPKPPRRRRKPTEAAQPTVENRTAPERQPNNSTTGPPPSTSFTGRPTGVSFSIRVSYGPNRSKSGSSPRHREWVRPLRTDPSLIARYRA